MNRILTKVYFDKAKMEVDPTKSIEDVRDYQENLEEVMTLFNFTMEKFIDGLLYKINPQTFYEYSIQTTNIEIYLNRTLFSELQANLDKYGYAHYRVVENSFTNSEIILPNGVLKNVEGFNEYNDLRVKFVKYIASPFIHKPDVHALIEAPVLLFEVYDVLGKQLKIDVGDTGSTGLIQIKMPYSPIRNLDNQVLSCKWYDSSKGDWSSDGCGYMDFDLFSYTEQALECTDCTYIKREHATCFCTHLSMFTLMYSDPLNTTTTVPALGLYTDYYALGTWASSMGFYCTLGGLAAYAIGLVIGIVWDIRP